MTREERNKYLGVSAGAAAGVVIFTSQPARAQTAITEMGNQLNEVSTVVDSIVPLAISSMVFGAGALIVKRFVYS